MTEPSTLSNVDVAAARFATRSKPQAHRSAEVAGNPDLFDTPRRIVAGPGITAVIGPFEHPHHVAPIRLQAVSGSVEASHGNDSAFMAIVWAVAGRRGLKSIAETTSI